ncbi:General stress protein 69 [Roseimaritima multifibrata]|uniref:General stress protein 69 n=1 Tax=Roseimaritima multifibrata TaxID=1930274 RepID=A0A517MKP4_9BACT|nr:aldo/keto reductase [Roseimaritima multifibrata]QDS95452.1 General stress protein 69 [Roseimaritima multifibrata]
MLPKRMLGNTGMEVTQLGYGTMGLRGPKTWGVRVVDEADAEVFLNLVLDSGINFIDTAPDYGIAEERIGRYLSDRRSEFYLATKCGCVFTQHGDHLEIDHEWDTDVIRRNIDTSLARLQTDYIDLLQFHGGDAQTLQSTGLIRLLEEYRDQGVIRHLGISSKLPNLEGLIDLKVFETFQIPYSCLTPEHGPAIARAAATGAGIIIRGGIAHGGPDAEIKREPLNDLWTAANLDALKPDEMTRAELVLRYTLSNPHCDTTIVGTCNKDHLKANLAAAKAGPLPDTLVQAISQQVASVLST